MIYFNKFGLLVRGRMMIIVRYFFDVGLYGISSKRYRVINIVVNMFFIFIFSVDVEKIF